MYVIGTKFNESDVITNISNGVSSWENRFQFKSGQNTYCSNYASYGGALFLKGLDITINENYFCDNSAIYNGGAMILEQSHATVYDCNFTRLKMEVVSISILNKTPPPPSKAATSPKIMRLTMLEH